LIPALIVILPRLGIPAESLAHVAAGTTMAAIAIGSMAGRESADIRKPALARAARLSWPWLAIGALAGGTASMMLDKTALSWTLALFAVGAGGWLASGGWKISVRRKLPGKTGVAAGAAGIGLFSALTGSSGGIPMAVALGTQGAARAEAHAISAPAQSLIGVGAALGYALAGVGNPWLPWHALGYVDVGAAVLLAAGMAMARKPAAEYAAASPFWKESGPGVYGFYAIMTGAFVIAKLCLG
jgi:uncharacterized membrane protein YfcA